MKAPRSGRDILEYMKTKTPQAVDACHALLLWMVPLLDNFPRNRRFSIGSRIEAHLLDILE